MSTNRSKPVPSRASEGASATVLANQLEKKQQELQRLTEERNAWAARAGAQIRLNRPVNYPGDHRTQTRLERIAAALLLADLSDNPTQGDNVTDGPGRITQGKNETGLTPAPSRRHAQQLRRTIDNALETWETAVEHNFNPPRPPRPPQVRCRNRQCSAHDIHFDAWRRIRGGKSIPYERCSGCGQPVTLVDPDASTMPSPQPQ